MRSKYTLIVVVLLVLGFGVGRLSAAPGTLDSPAPPDSTYSYTLEDIYQRLNGGTAGAQSTFAEPSGGPGTGTMHTLNQIMDRAPAADNTDGAVPAEVLTGKTYWSLRTDGSGGSSWGLETGTAAAGDNVSGPEGARTFTIPDGFYAGSKTATANDSDLAAGNIRSGVTIFGVSGRCYRLPATGQTASWGAGDDGAYRLGCRPLVGPCLGDDGCNFNRTDLPWTSSSGTGFTDNGDGTVTDNLTGLIWLQDASCSDLAGTDADGKAYWSTALSAANSLAHGTCGLGDGSSAGDWRLPNINELRSLINPAQTVPALPTGHPFTGVWSSNYWSSTTDASDSNYAWNVNLAEGYVHSHHKFFQLCVWPVRGGQ